MGRAKGRAKAQMLHGDLLYEIFDYTLPSPIIPGKALAASPLNVSLVCRQWRAAALERTSLWASLFVQFSGEGGSVSTRIGNQVESSMTKYINLWLKRSSPLPLDIVLDGGRSGHAIGDPETEKLFRALNFEMHRWGTVSFKNVSWGYMGGRVIGVLADISTSLSFKGNPLLMEDCIFDLVHIPQLRTLEASSVRIRVPPNASSQMSNLTHLNFSVAPYESLSDIISLLQASPNLVNITLAINDNVLLSSAQRRRPKPSIVSLARLSELRLTFLEACEVPFAYFLKHSGLICPALSTLVISDRRCWKTNSVAGDLEELNRFLTRSRARVLDTSIQYEKTSLLSFRAEAKLAIERSFEEVKRYIGRAVNGKFKCAVVFDGKEL